MGTRKDNQLFITPDEAMELILGGERVHTFRNPGQTMLMGCDIDRDRIKKIFDENAEAIQIGGKMCRKMKHAIVVVDDNGPMFVETDMDKLNAFDPIEQQCQSDV